MTYNEAKKLNKVCGACSLPFDQHSRTDLKVNLLIMAPTCKPKSSTWVGRLFESVPYYYPENNLEYLERKSKEVGI